MKQGARDMHHGDGHDDNGRPVPAHAMDLPDAAGKATVGKRSYRGPAIIVFALIAIVALALVAILLPRLSNPHAPDLTSAKASASTQPRQSATTDDQDRSDSVATLYLHGYNGGKVSTDSMIEYAEKHEDATKVLTVTISSQGDVKLTGTWPKHTKRPLIQVLFEDNTNVDYGVTSEWVHSLIVTLQQRYHIRRYNTVAHSMGNLVMMYYEMQYGQDTSLPKLEKQVNIAGNFDGIVGVDDSPNMNTIQADGSPTYRNQHFNYLLAHKNNYPDGVEVLNIFGNLDDGTNSDNNISTASARSLNYILKGKAASYREIEVHGKMGQHSKLHENPKVSDEIDAFLWGRG
ncbi:cell surface hydrolase [Bifidobacterium bombi DSM 19703]|uniref:Cell surface hydrolase n=2 Tax=Bifidobacterium bombi TaxID=471511 RepID=A0A086BPB5_9BIFI|nr:cell surface hydrolase [Bifidobacterium bombi DSM 19703]